MGHIYIITNQLTKDIYVGKTEKTLDERLKKHHYAMRYTSSHLYSAMKKYGIENFTIKSIELVENDYDLDDRERHHISQLSPKYNMTDGGDGGNTMKFISEETRNKFKKRSKGMHNPMFGKFGKDNPNFGKKRGPTPKISEALKNPCVCEGVWFDSITNAEKFYFGKHSVRKRLDNPKYPDWYRLVPKIKRK